MKTIEKLPLSLNKRSETEDLIRVPATWEEYNALLNRCEYPLQYHQGEIISMGFPGYSHELIIVNLLDILGEFLFSANYSIFTHKQLIYSPNQQASYYADISLTWRHPQFQTLGKYTQVILNPQVVVEILTETSRKFDLEEKWKAYQQIDSLQQVIFVETEKFEVNTYKKNQLNQWEVSKQEGLFASLQLADLKINLADMYRGIDLPA